MPTETTRFDAAGSECSILFGVVTSNEVIGGTITGVPPLIQAVAGDDSFDVWGDGGCNTWKIESSDFDSLDRAWLAGGASLAFYATVIVPEGTEVDYFLLEPGPTEAQFIPDAIGEIPAAPELGQAPHLDATLQPLQGATINYRDETVGWIGDEQLDPNEWRLDITGAATTPAFEGGSCVTIFGAMTLTAVDDVNDPDRWAPTFGLIADGRVFLESSCNDELVESAGYNSTITTDFVLGESVPFYVDRWIPEGSRLDAIMFEWDHEQLYRPDLMASIPPA